MENSSTSRLEPNEDIFTADVSHEDSSQEQFVPSAQPQSQVVPPLQTHPAQQVNDFTLNGITQLEYLKLAKELQQLEPDEKIIWMGRSSQKIHTGLYIICGLFFWLFFPLFIAYYNYLKTKNTIYVVTEERLHMYTGILTKRIDDVELYRVKDICYIQPFFEWIAHLSSVQLFTSEHGGDSSVTIPGIKDGMLLREKLRRLVEQARDKKGVKEVDYYGQTLPV